MFLTPRWILSHVFAATLICAFVAAGLWQVNRLGERQDLNARIEQRIGSAAMSLDDVAVSVPDDVEYATVLLSGQYSDRQLLVGNRSNEGTPGFWMWSVFELDSGGEVIVNRGFVARTIVQGLPNAAPLSRTDIPTGDVVVDGRLRLGLDNGRVAESRPEISRPDPQLAAEVLDLETAIDPSLYVELVTQAPPQAEGLPVPIPIPDLSEGPHRSYAFQWFTFATIGLGGYLLLLRRIRRGDQSKGDVPLSAV